jgi:hypothetical protein
LAQYILYRGRKYILLGNKKAKISPKMDYYIWSNEKYAFVGQKRENNLAEPENGF